MPEELDEEGLEEALNSGDTWVVDFWAEWCGPCKKMAPHFEEAGEEMDVNFGKVDMEEHQQLGGQMGVRALPTVLIFQDGEEIARKSGLMNKDQLKTWIESEA
ncbi:thioredoxin [Candidatus Haloredivivus sp. G17]|jgi:thioredoxin|nr:thioredoxin [Candidatus Haloredivivus sp. G17]